MAAQIKPTPLDDVRLYRAGGMGYHEAMATWQDKQARSRTYVGGRKAVRLSGRGLNNAVLYTTPANAVVCRLYDTDVVRWDEDGTVTLNTGGFETSTTFECIYRMTGANISKSSLLTTNELRIRVAREREGTAPWNVRASIPFMDGLRFNSRSDLVLVEDLKLLPSDRRKTYTANTKEAAKQFNAKLWSKLEPRIKFGMAIGSFREDVIESVQNGRIWGNEDSKIRFLSMEEVVRLAMNDALTDAQLLGAIIAAQRSRYFFANKVEQVATEVLEDGSRTFKTRMLTAFAKEFGLREERGGDLMGNGYFVSPYDMK